MFHKYRCAGSALVLSLALAAMAAAPAAARPDFYPLAATVQAHHPITHASTPPELCSEVCFPGPSPAITNPAVSTTDAVTVDHPQPTAVRIAAHDSGFDWGDAAIGAGVSALILLVIAGGAFAMTTRQGRQLGGPSASVSG